jgi:hypothetical protein
MLSDYITSNGRMIRQWWIGMGCGKNDSGLIEVPARSDAWKNWIKPWKLRDSWCPGRDSNRTPPEYKSRALSLLQPTRLYIASTGFVFSTHHFRSITSRRLIDYKQFVLSLTIQRTIPANQVHTLWNISWFLRPNICYKFQSKSKRKNMTGLFS